MTCRCCNANRARCDPVLNKRLSGVLLGKVPTAELLEQAITVAEDTLREFGMCAATVEAVRERVRGFFRDREATQ